MVIIFSGTSGSRKTSLANLLNSADFKIKGQDPAPTREILFLRSLWKERNSSYAKFAQLSADDAFMEGGKYKFKAAELPAAHQSCLRMFNSLVTDDRANIIVDNTNCTMTELAPYAALAQAYAHELHIITLLADVQKAFERNVHDVPYETVYYQDVNLRQRIKDTPPWYPQRIFEEQY